MESPEARENDHQLQSKRAATMLLMDADGLMVGVIVKGRVNLERMVQERFTWKHRPHSPSMEESDR